MTTPHIRVLIVDEHPVVRLGLTALLTADPRFAVAGEAGTLAQAIDAASRCEPDVVIMGVRLPDGTGIEACRTIRADRPGRTSLCLPPSPTKKRSSRQSWRAPRVTF